jgi:hypothetical protein
MLRILFDLVVHVWWRRQIGAEFMKEKSKKRDHLQEVRQIIMKFA